MNARPITAARRWLAALALASLVGCAAQGGSGSVSMESPGNASPDQPMGRAEGESADDLDAQKDRLVQDYRAKVIRASTDAAACEQLCSLATSICGVQEKLCGIADDHPADDHYQDLCREAKRECSETQSSCIACVEANSK